MRTRDTIVLCFILLSVSVSDAWLCNVTLIGKPSDTQTLVFSTADVSCSPGLHEANLTLSAGIDSSLAAASFKGTARRARDHVQSCAYLVQNVTIVPTRPRVFGAACQPLASSAGVVPEAAPDFYNSSLLSFWQDNITFQNMHLTNIDAWYLDYVFLVTGANNTLQGLVSTECSAKSSVVSIMQATDQDGSGTTLVSGANFNNNSPRALYLQQMPTVIEDSNFVNGQQAINVLDSDTTVLHTLFANLSWPDASGAAMLVANSDGSPLHLSNCSFLNNSAISGNDSTEGYVPD